MGSVKSRTGMVHDTMQLARTVIYLACNPGMSVGTSVGGVPFYSRGYSPTEEDPTCTKCLRRRNE